MQKNINCVIGFIEFKRRESKAIMLEVEIVITSGDRGGERGNNYQWTRKDLLGDSVLSKAA